MGRAEDRISAAFEDRYDLPSHQEIGLDWIEEQVRMNPLPALGAALLLGWILGRNLR